MELTHIHDSKLVYVMHDSERKTLTFRVKTDTDVDASLVFEGVEALHLDTPDAGTILMDVEKIGLHKVGEVCEKAGWAPFGFASVQSSQSDGELAEEMVCRDVDLYVLSSSVGMDALVAARSVRMERVAQVARPGVGAAPDLAGVRELLRLAEQLPEGVRADWRGTNHYEMTSGESGEYFWLDIPSAIEGMEKRRTTIDDTEQGRRLGLLLDLAEKAKACEPVLRQMLGRQVPPPAGPER